MKSPLQFLLPLLPALLLASCGGAGSAGLSPDIRPDDIRSHIAFLASDSLRGRETGTAGSARAANYIADRFRDFGLRPAGEGDSWFQEFRVSMSALKNPHRDDSGEFSDVERIARNVAGVVPGSEEPETYLVIGAHYDHLGMGRFGSLYGRSDSLVHNGADDNASGTSGVLELAHWFSRNPPRRSLLFLAFSGEEMGLLGSRHYVENPTVPIDSVMAMINLDMIGRLEENRLLIFGTGTSEGWSEILGAVETDSLRIESVPDGSGASDHTSFYDRGIPVLHYFTDTHSDYHRPSDDPPYINYEGEGRILVHLRRVISVLDTLDRSRLAYTEAPMSGQRDAVMEGPTLGVTPDYGFDAAGMRISGIRGGGPADRAGLRGGDIIIRLGDREVTDIYDYMEALSAFSEGDRTTVTVLREGREQVLDLRF